MAFCSKCGTHLSEGDNFCFKCGNALNTYVDIKKQNNIVCPHCGASVNKGDTFCTECGKRIVEKPVSDGTEPPHKDGASHDEIDVKANAWRKIILYIVGAVVILGVWGAWNYYSSQREIALADSLKKVRQDSIAHVKEMERAKRDSILKVQNEEIVFLENFYKGLDKCSDEGEELAFIKKHLTKNALNILKDNFLYDGCDDCYATWMFNYTGNDISDTDKFLGRKQELVRPHTYLITNTWEYEGDSSDKYYCKVLLGIAKEGDSYKINFVEKYNQKDRNIVIGDEEARENWTDNTESTTTQNDYETASNYSAPVFPAFKCFTDKENELLTGNVEKVVLYKDNKGVYEMCFNERGNYTTITSLQGARSTIYPFHNRSNRYTCEGFFVNNYYNLFFMVGLRDEDSHLPFWLHGISGGDKWSFSYDEKGKLSSITTGIYNHEVFCYTYDEMGRLLSRTYNGLPTMKLHWSGNDITGYYIYKKNGSGEEEYDLSINGNRIVVNNRHASYLKSLIETDNNGKITYYEMINNTDKIKIQVNCYYNRGLMEKMTSVYSKNKKRTTTTSLFKYDSHMNLTDYERIDRQGETVDQCHYKYIYRYDNNGNWISKNTYSIKKGDIEVKHKISSETREITYFD